MGRKTNKKNFHVKLIETVYDEIPAFTDIFTEESFYITVVVFVISTIVFVFIFSRFITIKPAD